MKKIMFEDKDVIVFAGDPVTDAGKSQPYGENELLGQGLGDGYVHALYDMLAADYPQINLRVINSGVGGNNSSQLMERWQTDVIDLKPDWISICIGINDVVNKFTGPERENIQVSYDEYRKNLESMIESGKKVAKGVMLISPYIAEPDLTDPLRREMDVYRSLCKETAKKYLCKYIDIQEMFDEYFQYRHQCCIAWDRIHPNSIGVYMIAKKLLCELEIAQA